MRMRLKILNPLFGIWCSCLFVVLSAVSTAAISSPIKDSAVAVEKGRQQLRTTNVNTVKKNHRVLRSDRNGPIQHFLFRSEHPSVSPSLSPSLAPTAAPSASPTSSPSISAPPTDMPSSAPSDIPSSLPSYRPSLSPSASPSISVSPSASPSSKPSVSMSPSSLPTLSLQPSGRPSISRNPSSSPSAHPTGVPSFSPTSNPTFAPSVVPSSDPTAALRKYNSIESILLPVIYLKAMDETTIQTFESEAERFISDNLPPINGVTTTVTNVELISQEFVVGTEKDDDNEGIPGGLQVKLNVAGDVFPGDPDNYSYDDMVGYGFQHNYTAFLKIISQSSTFFEGNFLPSALMDDSSESDEQGTADDNNKTTGLFGNEWSRQKSYIVYSVAAFGMVVGISLIVFWKRRRPLTIKFGKRSHEPSAITESSGTSSNNSPIESNHRKSRVRSSAGKRPVKIEYDRHKKPSGYSGVASVVGESSYMTSRNSIIEERSFADASTVKM